jgi:hypothetical protein
LAVALSSAFVTLGVLLAGGIYAHRRNIQKSGVEGNAGLSDALDKELLDTTEDPQKTTSPVKKATGFALFGAKFLSVSKTTRTKETCGNMDHEGLVQEADTDEETDIVHPSVNVSPKHSNIIPDPALDPVSKATGEKKGRGFLGLWIFGGFPPGSKASSKPAVVYNDNLTATIITGKEGSGRDDWDLDTSCENPYGDETAMVDGGAVVVDSGSVAVDRRPIGMGLGGDTDTVVVDSGTVVVDRRTAGMGLGGGIAHEAVVIDCGTSQTKVPTPDPRSEQAKPWGFLGNAFKSLGFGRNDDCEPYFDPETGFPLNAEVTQARPQLYMQAFDPHILLIALNA